MIVSNELLTGLLSFLFTVLVLSYLVGDNPGFRVAIHAFIGTAAGYVAATVFRQVVVDKLFIPLLNGDTWQRVIMILPLLFSLLLLTKMSARLEWLGGPVVAFLVGVGAAAAIAGAVMGTLLPQIEASAGMFSDGFGSLLSGGFVLFGTVVSLAYFQFSVSKKNVSGKRGKLAAFLALLGQIFIAMTLGVLFAGVLAAALTAFVDRIQSLVLFLDSFLR